MQPNNAVCQNGASPVQVWLVFEDTESQQPAYSLTVMIEAGAATVTGIDPGLVAGPQGG